MAILVSLVGSAMCWVAILGMGLTSFLEVLGGDSIFGEQSKTKPDKESLHFTHC